MRSILWLSFAGLVVASGCGTMDRSAPGTSAPRVVSVIPANGRTGVNPASPVVVTFSVSMMQGTEMSVALHEGSVSGPTVPATAQWSDDRSTLTLIPVNALKSATTYVIHLAPTMMSATGQSLDHGSCGGLGGQNLTGGMMGGTGHGGMMGGWEMANGSYGMVFTFTTG